MKKPKPKPAIHHELPLDRAPDRQETLTRVQSLIRDGELSLAYRIIASLLEKEPACVELLDALGAIYLRAGALESAHCILQQALHLHPDFADVHFHLAQVYAGRGELPRAIDYARQALLLHPDCTEYQEWMGHLNG